MLPPPSPTRGTIPGAAIAAAVFGLLSAAVPTLWVLFLVLIGWGELDATDWLYLLVPVGLIAALVVGAVRLLRGRSWLVLVVSAGTLAALALAGFLSGGWGGGPFGPLAALVPLVAAVLAALPGVRAWVAARQSAPMEV
jgi:hypothetical protein